MKKLYGIALVISTIGWFPFMWLSIWGSWNREAGMWVLLLGLVLCLFSGIILIGLLNNKALWLSQDKYNEHIQEFKDAKKIYEKASKQLINRALEMDSNLTWDDIWKAFYIAEKQVPIGAPRLIFECWLVENYQPPKKKQKL
jgi:hypothetical protein